MGSVRPGVVTVAGVKVSVGGGPWVVGKAVIRSASSVLYSPQKAYVRVGNTWVPVVPKSS